MRGRWRFRDTPPRLPPSLSPGYRDNVVERSRSRHRPGSRRVQDLLQPYAPDPGPGVITAVDTNVLIDVFGADRKFGTASANASRKSLERGAVVACTVVWAETATAFPEEDARLALPPRRLFGGPFAASINATAASASVPPGYKC